MAADEPRKETPDDDPEWLDARAAADFLGISERRLNQLRRRGEIPGAAISWRRWRYRVSDLMAYVRRSADRMTPPSPSESPDTAAPPETDAPQETTAPDDPPRMTVSDLGKILYEMSPPVEEYDHEDEAANRAPIVRMANAILVTAIEEGASEIHLETHRRHIGIRLRVDGTLREFMALPRYLQLPLFQRYKIMADCRPFARTVQRGAIRIRHGKTDYNTRLDVLPSLYSESMALRIFGPLPGLKNLHMHEEVLSRIVYSLYWKPGLLLIISPKGEGRTTTAFSALRQIHSVERKTLAIQSAVSYELPGVFHAYIQPEKGLTWRTATQTALTQSADTLLLSDLTDAEAAEAALYAAENGILTIATLTARDTSTALMRLSQWGIPRERLFHSLSGLLYQRLVRSPCPDCSSEYEAQLTERQEQEDVPQQLLLRRPVGCAACHNTGYRGRIAVHEMLGYFPDELEHPHRSFVRDLFSKLRDGFTTVEEAQRLLPDVRWTE
jgi:type II secretory ATPase GspE/PulE/Tfp pilus assembly ATPase PilB-like protein